MLDPKILDDLSKRFAEAMPSGLRQFQAEMEKNFHSVLQAAFAKMDLVTREEFDVQQGVLARTRAKLEALEKEVRELEEKLAPASRKRTSTSKQSADKGENS